MKDTMGKIGAVEKCSGCNLCVKECSFLQRTGNPQELYSGARECDPFECTLCGLCAAVCPLGVDPSRYFLQRRRETVKAKGADDPRHAPLIAYEKKGTSNLFTFYGFPKGCDTVFFPGCALPGSRPHVVWEVYEHLKKHLPNLGLVLDCCLKPSHDLGREEHFHSSFSEILDHLRCRGVSKVLVACPNCNRIFSDYGEDLSVATVYEVLAELPGKERAALSIEGVFHDPCVARFNTSAQDAARELVQQAGVNLAEMKHSRQMTVCCGRGGGVNFIRPDAIGESVDLRVAEAEGRAVITYCASCAATYRKKGRSLHLLDLWLSPQKALAGKTKVSEAPVTYLNRLLLKRKLRNSGLFEVMHERGKRRMEGTGKSGAKAAALLLAIIAAAIVARVAGADRFLDLAALRHLVEGHEVLGPVVFIALFTLAPALFLPGLPLTIAAGLLFGPVLGVVYAIIGATSGASLSFLVARYLARDWVAAKLTGPMWKNLDEKVAREGWKVVAITRLIPLFPFNLLNYAFGVTTVSFRQYVVASFFCMLPACVAFIVFSSSLPQLLKGRISPSLVIGALLMGVVLLIPTWYRRRRGVAEVADHEALQNQ